MAHLHNGHVCIEPVVYEWPCFLGLFWIKFKPLCATIISFVVFIEYIPLHNCRNVLFGNAMAIFFDGRGLPIAHVSPYDDGRLR